MNKYSLVIFDLDDTLFDYSASEIQAIKYACLKSNIVFNDELYCKYKVANNIAKRRVNDFILHLDEFRLVRAKIFLDSINQSQVNAVDFVKDYLLASENGILIDGVESTLTLLKGMKIVVGTNGSTYPRRNKLENSSIARFFCDFYSSEQLGVAKPNPDFFLSICKAQSVSPSRSLIVGNSYREDVTGAIAAGIDVCLISDIEFSHPNVFVISSISNLLEVVNELHKL